jgi:hypothetical protein
MSWCPERLTLPKIWLSTVSGKLTVVGKREEQSPVIASNKPYLDWTANGFSHNAPCATVPRMLLQKGNNHGFGADFRQYFCDFFDSDTAVTISCKFSVKIRI